jgi:hypothetical protein
VDADIFSLQLKRRDSIINFKDFSLDSFSDDSDGIRVEDKRTLEKEKSAVDNNNNSSDSFSPRASIKSSGGGRVGSPRTPSRVVVAHAGFCDECGQLIEVESTEAAVL